MEWSQQASCGNCETTAYQHASRTIRWHSILSGLGRRLQVHSLLTSRFRTAKTIYLYLDAGRSFDSTAEDIDVVLILRLASYRFSWLSRWHWSSCFERLSSSCQCILHQIQYLVLQDSASTSLASMRSHTKWSLRENRYAKGALPLLWLRAYTQHSKKDIGSPPAWKTAPTAACCSSASSRLYGLLIAFRSASVKILKQTGLELVARYLFGNYQGCCRCCSTSQPNHW